MSKSWWRGVTDLAARSGAPLSQRADVVVVGAGLIGAAIARSLASQGASVVLVDAGMPGDGASGELLGICDVGTSWPLAELAGHTGISAAREVFALSQRNSHGAQGSSPCP